MLCLPFFTDQYHNVAIVEKYEFGKGTSLEASEEELFDDVKELLDNQK